MSMETESSATTEVKSFCRMCQAGCGMVVELDHNCHVVNVRGDKDDLNTMGFACSKGLQAPEAHNGAGRILRPLKRTPQGTFEPIALEQALDEIATIMRGILDRDGPEAFAGFKGSGAYNSSASSMMLLDWLNAIGSHKIFSGFTIDQSAKLVALERIGFWPPGFHPFHQSDVAILFGGNPLVSLASLDFRNPIKRLRDAKARGLTFIVVDPRFTETAKFADIFVQPLPGEDASIVSAMLRIILKEGWYDKKFCDQHVGDLDLLRKVVEPFTPEYVANRADIPVEKLWQITEAFAAKGKRGVASSATGPDMGPHSNLAEHLITCLNIVCGRCVREGEKIDNPGFIQQRRPRPAQVIPAPRSWEHGPKSRIGGYGMIFGEMMTGILADEILVPGPGQVKFMISHGGNPAASVPDQRKVVKALRSLDLLVSIEPYMTSTAKLAHYILPPKLMYERSDLPLWQFEELIYPYPFSRYTPAISSPPAGSEVENEWYFFWALAKRLGIALKHQGTPLDMTERPKHDDLLAVLARHSPVPFEELRQLPLGVFFDGDPQFASPADPNTAGKFTLMPPDVYEELGQLAGERVDNGVTYSNGSSFSHRIAVRRNRHRFNSLGHTFPALKKRVPYNPAYLNPLELEAIGVASGEWVQITSDSGSIVAIAEADATVRRGVVQINHAFGNLPDDSPYREYGSSPNLLISTDRDLQTINAMPRMSGIPVNIRRAAQGQNWEEPPAKN